MTTINHVGFILARQAYHGAARALAAGLVSFSVTCGVFAGLPAGSKVAEVVRGWTGKPTIVARTHDAPISKPMSLAQQERKAR